MRPASPISVLPGAAASTIRVDDFTIDYRADGSVAQFYSTLSLTDPEVREVPLAAAGDTSPQSL